MPREERNEIKMKRKNTTFLKVMDSIRKKKKEYE